ncbi:hypothetical protein [Novipirellula caenicola]|uniref:Uncharacterized protein n=1 Tax=Novipirellula caenicola TaxID=1536901 RepID=A0ABP9VYZ2_9BACT
MSELIIIAAAPIRLDRDVAGGETLATVETDLTERQLAGLGTRSGLKLESRKVDGVREIDILDANQRSLARITTEHSLATLFVMLRQGQAVVKSDSIEETNDDDSHNDSQTPSDDFAAVLRAAKASKRTIELLAENGVTGIAKARLFLAEHEGSFESIDGIGEKTNEALLEALAEIDAIAA